MPTISVIIPVFNCEDFLDRCILSVLSQKYSDFELLLIDDGSTDHSPEIIDRYAGADSRVKAIHCPNHGVSAARNVGIEHSSGVWITFIDSDDYVFPDYLSDLINLAIADGCDLVITGSTSGPDYQNVYPDVRVDRQSIPELISKYHINVRCPVWGKLFRASIIKGHVKFNESSSWSEDVMFVWRVLTLIDSARLSSKTNYFYELRPGSISWYIFSFDKEFSSFIYARDLLSELKSHFGDDFAIRHFGLHKFLLRAIWSLQSGRHSFLQRLRRMYQIRFDRTDIEYAAHSRSERLYQKLLTHKLWLPVDIMTRYNLRKMKVRFKQ